MDFSITPSNEPTVTAILDPPPVDLSPCPRYGSVHLMALNLETRTVLSKFDRNGDGDIDPSELEEVVDELVKAQFKSRLFLSGMLMVGFSLLLLLGSGFGLTWAVVLAQKDTTVQNGVLMAASTNQPVQVANMHYTVDTNGVLSQRGAGALSTSALYVQRILHANMTDSDLAYLIRVHVIGDKGEQIGLRVTGYKTEAGSPAQLHVHTPSGSIVVVGSSLDSSSVPTNLLDSSSVTWIGVAGVFRK